MGEQLFNIRFGDFGNGKEEVNVEELDYTPYRANEFNLVVMHGKKYISTALVSTLCGRCRPTNPSCQYGRMYLFEVNEALLEEVLEHVNYPRRNDWERAVAKRNLEIISRIVDL